MKMLTCFKNKKVRLLTSAVLLLTVSMNASFADGHNYSQIPDLEIGADQVPAEAHIVPKPAHGTLRGIMVGLTTVVLLGSVIAVVVLFGTHTISLDSGSGPENKPGGIQPADGGD